MKVFELQVASSRFKYPSPLLMRVMIIAMLKCVPMLSVPKVRAACHVQMLSSHLLVSKRGIMGIIGTLSTLFPLLEAAS